MDHSSLAYMLGGLDHRVETLEQDRDSMRGDIKTIRTQLDQIRAWGMRLGILVALWAAALGSHLTREQSSELLAALIKALLASLK